MRELSLKKVINVYLAQLGKVCISLQIGLADVETSKTSINKAQARLLSGDN